MLVNWMLAHSNSRLLHRENLLMMIEISAAKHSSNHTSPIGSLAALEDRSG